MKRFIDIRGQGTAYRFCWFDTRTDQVEKHGTNTVWDTFDEFAEDYKGDELERYRSLTPAWAFIPDPNDALWKDEDDDEPTG